MRTRHLFPATALLLSILTIPAASKSWAQPRPDRPLRPPPSWGIRGQTDVDARLDGTILQVACEQTFRNDGSRMEEVEILIPIPPDAVVTDGLLLADGREYAAEVLDAEQARAIYEGIVRARRDPALLELAGHGLVRLSAFPIPPGGERSVSFRYHQMVASPDGSTRILFPVAALCGLDRRGPLSLRMTIEGGERITSVYSPSHDIEVDREGATRAHLSYASDSPDPHETLEIVVARDASGIGIDVRTARGYGEDGYFLIALSPGWDLLGEREGAHETITFILDTSGSMEGEKFHQAIRALRGFLDEMSSRDSFNLIAFSSGVHSLFPRGPRPASREARAQARTWIDRLDADGGTALAAAIEEGCRTTPEGGLILLLTDGLPTVGEQDRDRILDRARRLGRGRRFYAFGVGYDVDALLLDGLARQGSGSVSYVRPGEDIEEAVTTLRRRVERPCATNVRIRITGAGTREVFPEGPQVLFAGEPLLYAGRITRGRRATVHLTATGPDGRQLRTSYRVALDDASRRSASVPVLWASRKAAALIDAIRSDPGDHRSREELLALSRRYGILNEEVALLAREDTDLWAQADPRPGASRRGGPMNFLHEGQRSAQAPAQILPPASPAKKEVELSAKTWELRSLDAADLKIAGEAAGPGEARHVEGRSFKLEGETWIDTEIKDPLPAGMRTIRLRTYGDAYFRLVSESGPLAAWLATGERVRVQLPDLILEIDPEASDSVSAEAMQAIRQALQRLS